MTDISVVIPTHNRAAFLGRCLASLCEQTLDPSRYEICVVNNASTDNTPQAVEQAAKNYPKHNIRMVDEPVTGVTAARNTGVRETSAPLIAQGDDDATMPPDWLALFIDRFATLGADLAKVGGEIAPVWMAPRPDWITDEMLPLLSAASGCGDKATFTEGSLLEGNSCYRREAFVSVGGFPRELGRKGNLLISADHTIDIVLCLRGWKMYYDPAITINHAIHADRLNPAWFRRRYFWQGVSDYAGRAYLKRMGYDINYALKLELPLDPAEWAFINNPMLPPTEAHLAKFRSLGLVLAKTGIIPIES